MNLFKMSFAVLAAVALTAFAAWAAGPKAGKPAPAADPPGYNSNAPVYVQANYPRADYSGVKVAMPAKIPLGQHPAIYLSRDDFLKLRDTLKNSPRGQHLLAHFTGLAKQAEGMKIDFPDPKVPAQLKDRDDPAAKAHDRLSNLAGALGYAYQLTDNEVCAQKVREILVGYAKLYPNDYAEHHGINGPDTGKIFSQRLSEAMWLLPIAQAYDMIYNSKCLTAEDHKLIERDLLQAVTTFIIHRDAAAEVARRDKANPNWRTADTVRGRKAYNWTNFDNAAYIQVGIATANQNWIDIGIDGTKFNIVNGIGDDGMWDEGAIGYQQFARMALVGCLEPLARQGLDLYGYDKCRVKNLWDAIFSYAYPDGSCPGINDSGRIGPPNDYMAGAYDFAWLRYGDKSYAPIINGAPRQIAPSQGVYFPTLVYDTLPVAPNTPPPGIQTSLVFDSLGYAIMRGREHDLPTYLLFNYSQPNGPHAHPDKLNLLLFADGDELAGEPTFYRYEDSKHANWTKTTIAHFTLAVDQQNQANAPAKLLAYADAGPVKVMRAQCPAAYPGVLLDRTVVQMPGYVADIYRGSASTPHSYDYPLCFSGKLDQLAATGPAGESKDLGSSPGYNSLKIAKTIENSADAWTGEWHRAAGKDNPANDVRVNLLGAPATTIYLCRDVDARDRVIVRRSGAEAVFASVINPYKGDSAVASVEPLKVDGPVPAAGLRVKRTDGGQDLIIVRFDPQTGNQLAAPSAFDGGKTNALVTVLRLDAKGKLLAPSGFLGGTFATCAGVTIDSSSPGIKWTK